MRKGLIGDLIGGLIGSIGVPQLGCGRCLASTNRALGVCECLIGSLMGGLIGLMRESGGCCQLESQTGADEAARRAPHRLLALPKQRASGDADNPFHAAVRGS